MMLKKVTSSLGATRQSTSSRPVVCVRADPRVTNGRTVKEDDNGNLSTSSAEAPLYADEVKRTMKPKSNLSPEMKNKLKQEYTGWGGSENKANFNFLWVILIVATLAVASHLIGAI